MITSEKYVILSIDLFKKIIKKSLIRKWYFSIRNFVGKCPKKHVQKTELKYTW